MIEITDKTPKGILLSEKSSNDLSYIVTYIENCTLYEKLLQESQEHNVIARKLSDWVAELHSINKLQRNNNNATRIASEDVTWWTRNGFTGHYMGFEKSMGRHLQDNLSILCGYNISENNSKMIDNNGTMDAMIATHGYVILDEPYTVYRAPQMGY